ncbi:hypothetical protein BV898_15278 [Hypsibius exemplaris]|uniref:Amine oxidase domain-containing protein n=1 Tax=Hypsibius exemplaris TaxID=2072580 RepID=A0A9X6NAP1_HYPEX|nr:hypothetical protein BV898_15278 [Hypsibius exemplaris]
MGKISLALNIGNFVLISTCVVITSLTLAYYLENYNEPAAAGNATHDGKQSLECSILIIGSGFAGSFAAYKLAPIYNQSVCLVERLNRDGGRIRDISEYPGGPVFGVGALRIKKEHLTIVDLAARELGMELQPAAEDIEILKVRGRHFFRKEHGNDTTRMCLELFPTMNCRPDGKHSTEQLMLAELLRLHAEGKHLASVHPDLPTLLLEMFGDEGLAFLRECVRYNSVFTSVSVHGILDFFSEDLRATSFDPKRLYPKGGMSEFIKRMLAVAVRSGLRIHRGEPVERVATNRDGSFQVDTKRYSIRAEKVLCSIDPLGFTNVQGDVADRIKSSQQFRFIAPKTLAIVTAWWNERWWETSELHLARGEVSRLVSHANCFNTMDIPTFPYGRDQNATRAVYDDGACVNTWRTLIGEGQDCEASTSKLADEVVNSLQHFYGPSVVVPRPRKLCVYPIVKGSRELCQDIQHPTSTITNKEIFEWSQHPLVEDNFALIGEAYHLDFAAWCDGAMKSTMTVLMKYYNITFPCIAGEDGAIDHGSPASCPKSGQKIPPNKRFDSFNIHGILP